MSDDDTAYEEPAATKEERRAAAAREEEYAARSIAEIEAGRLPLRAQERLSQLRGDEAFTSNLTIAEHHSVRSVGFAPVGQVMGSCVYQIGYTGTWDCGVRYGGQGFGGPGLGRMGGGFGAMGGPVGGGIAGGTASGGYGQAGFGGGIGGGFGGAVGTVTTVEAFPLRRALLDAQRRARDRMLAECQALGGDGVVAVRFTWGPFLDSGALEFQAIGTAVRAIGDRHVRRPFSSDLSGQDFARLLQTGWMPVELAFGVAVLSRHDDYRTWQQQRSWQNTEMSGYTTLMHEARSAARTQIARDVAAAGGEGVVLAARRERISEHECRLVENGRDHVVEAYLVGTAIARLPDRRVEDTGPPALPMLRLSGRGKRPTPV